MMKKIALLLALCCLSAALFGQGRDAFEEIRQDPYRAGSVFYMYNHDGIPAHAAAPKGFKPFYISHYGRHGARNHSANSDYESVMALFSAAHQRGLLTERGEEFLKRYRPVYEAIRGCGGDLTGLGREQQHKIAHNMYRNYPRVFRKNARIDAVSTIVPRCILTMSAFAEQLQHDNPRLQIDMQASNSTMGYLNPFSLSNPDIQPTDEGYNNKYAYWQKGYRQMCEQQQTPEAVFSPLLKDLSILEEFGGARKLECDVFAIALNAQCNEKVEKNLLEFIPYDELCKVYECYNYRFYCSKGADTLWQKGRQWAFVWRTMQDIIDKADSDISTGEYAARLRFGHDIIAMSLFVLLDIDGYNKPAGKASEVKDVFRSYDFPMSLNIQFVFYRNCKGEILVRMMYNERDMALPIADCGTPYYYRWEDLRAFALKRIEIAKGIIASTQAPPKVKN